MEQWIRRDPEQYLWLHKRFKGVFLYEDPLPWAL
jgi:lauroyl/myristoyl acyltransferase